MDFAAVEHELQTAIEAGAFPGAVILIGRGGKILYHAAFGSRSLEPERTPMHADTIFDLS
jgi:CubicO group peptidase (beta-lactamase class C family)